MVLSQYSHKFGMTFGQILTATTMLIALIGFVYQGQLNTAELKVEIKALDMKYDIKTKQLESAKDVNVYNIEQGRKENREEHYILNTKMDELLKAVQK